MKLYQLTVHRTPEEEQEEAAEEELELPIVENMEQFRGETSPPPLSRCEVDDTQKGAGRERRDGNVCRFCFLISINHFQHNQRTKTTGFLQSPDSHNWPVGGNLKLTTPHLLEGAGLSDLTSWLGGKNWKYKK